MKVSEYRKVQAYVSLEHQDGALLADYLEELRTGGKIALYTHIAHGADIPSKYQRHKLKLEGWKTGFPDYVIITPKTVLFLELKRTHGGVVSPEQKEWILHLADKKTEAVVAKGYYHAKELIDKLIDSGI